MCRRKYFSYSGLLKETLFKDRSCCLETKYISNEGNSKPVLYFYLNSNNNPLKYKLKKNEVNFQFLTGFPRLFTIKYYFPLFINFPRFKRFISIYWLYTIHEQCHIKNVRKYQITATDKFDKTKTFSLFYFNVNKIQCFCKSKYYL